MQCKKNVFATLYAGRLVRGSENFAAHATLSNEKLCPVIYARRIAVTAHADRRKFCVEDIGPVPGTVHPGLHNLLGCSLSPCYIFASASIAHTLFGECRAEAAPIGPGVGKRPLNFFGPDQRRRRRRLADRKRGKTRFGPLLVDQLHHLLRERLRTAPSAGGRWLRACRTGGFRLWQARPGR